MNFTRAAEELNLTQSAVSRQVRNLEDFLGLDLFARVGKRLELTEAGGAYGDKVQAVLAELEAETLMLMTRDTVDNALTLGVYPTFGSFWLIPRLNGFAANNPEIQLNLITGTMPFDLGAGDVDMAIQYGSGSWPGTAAHLISAEEMVAVCAPALVDGRDDLPADEVRRFAMLQLKSRPHAWSDWLRAKGADSESIVAGPSFEFFNMMTRAAVAGLGVAIMPTMFIAEELRTGQLITPFGSPVASRDGYCLAYLERHAQLPKVAAFRNWVLAEL